MHCKYVVVGAGLAGLTVAERIANEKNEKVGRIFFIRTTGRCTSISGSSQSGMISGTGC